VPRPLQSSFSCQEVDQFFASEACFPQQRHESAFGQIAIVLWNYGTTARGLMIVDAVAAGGVIQNEAALFKEANDLSRFDRGDFRHHLLLYQLRILKTTCIHSRYCGNVES
jgi:hypothetical protein